MHTIGAGGGSLAALDAAGMLAVGPHSAGADPGPICYGRGGRRPTITDANLVLGRLPEDRLLAVERPVAKAEVAAIIETDIGRPLGLDAAAAAAAILRIGNDRMAGAIRMVSLSRGEDPRDFALFAFGGAGPLHACALAAELGIPKVLIPPRPGITNAIGCAVSDARYDFVQTVNRPLGDTDMAEVGKLLRGQIALGRARLDAEGLTAELESLEVRHSADMQFRGQTHILTVSLPGAELSRERLQGLFEAAYFERFAVRLPEIGTLLVNLNTTVIGRRRSVNPGALLVKKSPPTDPSAALLETRPVWFAGGWRDTPVYDRAGLAPGAAFAGPAVVQQLDTTSVIEPDNRVSVDGNGNLLIEVPSAWEGE